MTALAFTAVIALLTVMMAFVNGMKKLTQQTGQPGNVLVLADGATDEVISNLTVGDLADIENLPEVVRENGRPMASRETFLVANQPIADSSDGRPKRRFLQLRGIEDPRLTARVHHLELLPGGNWFSEAGVQEAPAERSGDRPRRRWCRPCWARESPMNWPAAAPPRSWPPPRTAIGSTSAIPSSSATRRGLSWASSSRPA